jgi:serine/threonine-protein kinase
LFVLVAVGAGLAAYFGTRGHHRKTAIVPAVIGQSESSASAQIRDRGFSVEVDRSPGNSPAGTVVSQRPGGGTKMSVRRTVRLGVSSGPKEVAVPNVVSLNEADAVAEVTRAGLNADVFQVPSSQKSGKVLAQNPAPGMQVASGAKVRLNVSQGQTSTTTTVTTATSTTTAATQTATTTTSRTATLTRTTRTRTQRAAPTTVPNSVGETLAASLQGVRSANLLANAYPVQSSEAGGTVVDQNPAAGKSARSGSIVRLNVSLGTTRPRLAVPSVEGKTPGAAEAALARTFTFRIVYRTESSGPSNVVVGQLPKAGSQSRRWAQVVIYVSR